ncbi:hypothetical protein ABIC83_002611 [Roseateles asaccharophilus]|uniref:deoxynucleotide monophosphate kinase family protein n=1 Tax=Roseateles asaccharophilus TaxID=582607 RepID=UPI00383269BD
MQPTTSPSATPAVKQLLTTSKAAHVILGGTNVDSYWGFTFEEFLSKLQKAMTEQIGNPGDAPWRRHIDFTAQDYLELESLISRLDFSPNPADHLDEHLAQIFVRRCDLVGMHGGKNGIGVGKDTAAAALAQDGFVSMSFADPLKASVSMAYGVPLRYLTDRALKESPLPGSKLTSRRLMQLWGTEVVRSVRNDLWLKRHQLSVASAIREVPRIAHERPERVSALGGIRVAVPDVRFAAEGSYIRDLGGFVAWISRPDHANLAAGLSNGHASEAGIPAHPTDLQLVNEGSLESFQTRARAEILDRFTPASEVTSRRSPRPR